MRINLQKSSMSKELQALTLGDGGKFKLKCTGQRRRRKTHPLTMKIHSSHHLPALFLQSSHQNEALQTPQLFKTEF
jgi:hypothetical protein